MVDAVMGDVAAMAVSLIRIEGEMIVTEMAGISPIETWGASGRRLSSTFQATVGRSRSAKSAELSQGLIVHDSSSAQSSGYDATVDPVVIMVSHQNSTMLDRLGFLHVRGEALQALRPAHFHSGQILRGRWCYGQNLCVQR